jgi:alkaline phosphatase D
MNTKYFKSAFWVGAGLAGMLSLATPVFAQADLISGPMVGYTDTHSSRIWVQTDEAGKIQIEYWQTGSSQIQRSAEYSSSEKSQFTALLSLKNLLPEQSYEYRVLLDGQPIKSNFAQIFRTPAAWQPGQKAPNFQVLTGSCFYVNDDWMKLLGIKYGGPLNIFKVMENVPADFMLWLGDNVYMSPFDVSNALRMNTRYRTQRSMPILQPLLAKMPQLAIWDDHDFGPNNSSGVFPLKDVSLELFKTYWANPRYGLVTEPGTWSRLSWNDIDFFLTDGRYYRSASKVPEGQRELLGKSQLAWLKNELKASKAPFKIIAMGSPVFNQYYDESYVQYQPEFQDFLNFLQAEKIEGVVFLSGDRHHADLHKYPNPSGYTYYNFTSSPLTSLPTQVMSKKELHDPHREPGTLFQAHNFGLMRFEGVPGQRKMIMETHDETGKLIWEYTINEQELKYKP